MPYNNRCGNPSIPSALPTWDEFLLAFHFFVGTALYAIFVLAILVIINIGLVWGEPNPPEIESVTPYPLAPVGAFWAVSAILLAVAAITAESKFPYHRKITEDHHGVMTLMGIALALPIANALFTVQATKTIIDAVGNGVAVFVPMLLQGAKVVYHRKDLRVDMPYVPRPKFTQPLNASEFLRLVPHYLLRVMFVCEFILSLVLLANMSQVVVAFFLTGVEPPIPSAPVGFAWAVVLIAIVIVSVWLTLEAPSHLYREEHEFHIWAAALVLSPVLYFVVFHDLGTVFHEIWTVVWQLFTLW